MVNLCRAMPSLLQTFEQKIRPNFFAVFGNFYSIQSWSWIMSPEDLLTLLKLVSQRDHEYESPSTPCIGVQEISFAQKHSTQILWNTATIATFFSAVTGKTIIYVRILFIVRQ